MSETRQSAPRIPATAAMRRAILIEAIEQWSGTEWTPAQVKRLYDHSNLTHVYGKTMRRQLADLHADGYLTLHESPGRRFYTAAGGSR